jgi:hypothetical protein
MKTSGKTHRYVEWFSSEEMHADAIHWLSELNFIRDEQMFLNSLIKSYTLQLIDKKIYDHSKDLVSNILDAEQEAVKLMKRVQAHENQLEIMTDDVDQPKMERAYLQTHKDLMGEMQQYAEKYRDLKKRLFNLLSAVIKKEKQKRLLN